MNPADLTRSPEADPVTMYRYRDGLYAADLLTAALVWLDFFTWLSEHPSTKSEICASFKFADRPVDVMLTLFRSMGLLGKENEKFVLTTLAREQMVKGSPWFLGPYYASLKDRPITKDYLKVLETGKPANWGSFKNEQDWAKAMENPEFAANFTAAMDCRGVYLGRCIAQNVDLRERSQVLDIGGGSGIYSCSLVAHNPALKATVFEKSPVDKVARQNIVNRGYEAKVDVMTGDFFKEALPSCADVHLISNVLHDWEEPAVEMILQKSADALPKKGLLIIHDAHINAEKSGPLPVAAYSAMLMHSTEGKCYSVSEIETYLHRAGFQSAQFTATGADRSIITAIKS